MSKQLILCDCLGSQKLDPSALSAATGLRCSKVHKALCTTEIASAAAAIEAGDALIACAQETQRFSEVAEELEVDTPLFVDLRDRAGWSDAKVSTPKMAALIADALLPAPQIKTVDVASEGRCLILGSAAVTLPAAERLAETPRRDANGDGAVRGGRRPAAVARLRDRTWTDGGR